MTNRSPTHSSVLVIEDDEIDFLLLQRLLKQHLEFSLTHKKSLDEGYQWIHHNSCQLVILDLGLPGSSGVETLLEFRQQVKDLPVIVLTGLDDEQIGDETIHYGAQDYLVKGSFKTHDLKRSIRYAIERHRLDQMRTQFVSTISHELRTPLAIFQGAISNIEAELGTKSSDLQKNMFTLLRKNVERLGKIINNTLTLSRLESSQAQFYKSKVHISQLIDECCHSFHPLATEQGISLSIHSNETEEIPAVYANNDMISQVLMNLLSNAIRYAKSSIDVTITMKDSFIEARVKDDGAGISIDHQKNLFDKFVQVNRQKETNDYKGTGLGLAICKEIVTQNGGSIQVESRLDQGSQFFFTIPLFDPTKHIAEMLTARLQDNQVSTEQSLFVFPEVSCQTDRQTELLLTSITDQLRPEDWSFYDEEKKQLIILSPIGRDRAEAMADRLSSHMAMAQNVIKGPIYYGLARYPNDAMQPMDLYQIACENAAAQQDRLKIVSNADS